MKKLCLGFIFFVLLWICGFFIFSHNINHIKSEPREKVDAIIVLTGGKNRISNAFELLNKGFADKLFISGVSPNVSLENIAQKNGLSEENLNKVELGKAAHNTIENAIETREWIIDNNVKSIYLVTSNYHTPRSMAEFEDLNPDIKIYTSPVYSENVSRKWWSNFGTFRLIFSEYNKFLFVKINHLVYKFLGD